MTFRFLQHEKIKEIVKIYLAQWPNLMNLSGGLNLIRGLNMVGST